jgi:putative hydrolase of the HAD superfamily
MVKGIEVLLFDLGGVLVEFTGVQDIAPLLRTAASETEIRDRWSRCQYTYAFHVGKLSPEEFGDQFVRDWDLNVTPQEFLKQYRSWSKCLFPGAKELLGSLRSRYRLVALSNSNELHWDRNTRDLGITQLFEMAISSHQLGLCKPDPAIYAAALKQVGASPDSILFFDDLQANVVAASALGIRAYQVDGVAALRDCLARANLL